MHNADREVSQRRVFLSSESSPRARSARDHGRRREGKVELSFEPNVGEDLRHSSGERMELIR